MKILPFNMYHYDKLNNVQIRIEKYKAKCAQMCKAKYAKPNMQSQICKAKCAKPNVLS